MVAALATLREVIGRLPGSLLFLCALQVILFGGLLAFVHAEARHREAVYKPLLASCLRVLERP